jgi:hypothetical protein
VKGSELAEVRAAIGRRERRLAEERDRRKRYMRRGEYSWTAQHAGLERPPENRMLNRVRRNVEALRRLRLVLR